MFARRHHHYEEKESGEEWVITAEEFCRKENLQ